MRILKNDDTKKIKIINEKFWGFLRGRYLADFDDLGTIRKLFSGATKWDENRENPLSIDALESFKTFHLLFLIFSISWFSRILFLRYSIVVIYKW